LPLDFLFGAMIKKISIDDLIPGMYVHDLNCGWMEHPFLNNTFLVDGKSRIAKIRSLGIKDLYIDTELGLDLFNAPTAEEVDESLQARIEEIADVPDTLVRSTSLMEEAPRARQLYTEANRLVRDLMHSVRMGMPVDVQMLAPMLEGMIDSLFRNQSALLPLTALKQHDTYTFEHSVSVAALMTTFARSLEMSRETIREIALGAILHDVGKSLVPDAILNKPAELNSGEFARMRRHVTDSVDLLQNLTGITSTALQVAGQHHERYDGSGYPHKLRGDGISLYGRMASIVDVYDAVSSDRVYHKGLRPSETLKKLLEWSAHHFESRLVHSFIRAIGIYPAGSLVRLESGRLAIVREQNEGKLLYPVVTVIYDVSKQQYLPPENVDLTSGMDQVISYEDYSRWNIDPSPWRLA
jgi:putative nucleotidyltransferase with HDIG domain